MSDENPAVFIYGMQSKTFTASGFACINDAWRAVAGELGADPTRGIRVRSSAVSLDPTAAPLAGTTYTVSVALGDKGTRD